MSTKRKLKKKTKNEKRIKTKVAVKAVVCYNCGLEIYSRCTHDHHYCLCGMVSVDGGFDYLKIGFKDRLPRIKVRFINASVQELYDDWNYQINEFGIIGVEGWTNKTLNAD